MIRRKRKQSGSHHGPGPKKDELRSRSWGWLRACIAGLAMLTGVALPTLATSPAWAALGPNAYVANFGSDNVSVIDTTTNTVVGNPIPVGTRPVGVAITPDV
ncbi:hypothetical protein ACWCZ6_40685, partial [Streptomyces sp. NPDC001635]